MIDWKTVLDFSMIKWLENVRFLLTCIKETHKIFLAFLKLIEEDDDCEVREKRCVTARSRGASIPNIYWSTFKRTSNMQTFISNIYWSTFKRTSNMQTFISNNYWCSLLKVPPTCKPNNCMSWQMLLQAKWHFYHF